jgi:tetratricopeptide (TPR) repeat protein
MTYYGRLREARQLTARQVKLLEQDGSNERVGFVLSSQANSSAFLGETALARSQAEAVTQKSLDVSANLAFCYAALGDEARARRYFQEIPPGSIPDAIREALVQNFEAVIALTKGRPQAALERLKEVPADGNPSMIANTLFARAEAHRALKQFAEAERDYRAVLAANNPFPFALNKPFSHVGLARTLAAAGNADGARREYQTFLELWNGADQDLTLVREVRAELAKLRS